MKSPFEHAVAQLLVTAEICANNARINQDEGNLEQAALERETYAQNIEAAKRLEFAR